VPRTPNLPLARAKLLLVVEENSVMRLVVITGEQPHHKHLCASLYAAHELIAYHPLTRAVGLRPRLRRLSREISECGAAYTLARLAAKFPRPFQGWDVKPTGADFRIAERNVVPRRRGCLSQDTAIPYPTVRERERARSGVRGRRR
jgi:hypothetical protein